MSVAIVTGSDSSLGKATAVRLARDGHDIGLIWRDDAARLRDSVAACEKYRVYVEARRIDPTVHHCDPRDEISAIEELIDALGGVDVFVNHDIESCLAMQRAGWWMVEHGRAGQIIAVTSANAGLVGDMALELANKGITVNAVAPSHPGEVAVTVAWLVSSNSSCPINRPVLIDGGVLPTGVTANPLAS
jgi:hypothetical protein